MCGRCKSAGAGTYVGAEDRGQELHARALVSWNIASPNEISTNKGHIGNS